MNSDQFEMIFEETVAKMRKVLVEKAKEYADDGDRLHNFNVAAHLVGGNSTPELACWEFLVKHLVSIRDAVTGENVHDFPPEFWDEKIGDALNYFVLLRAILHETAMKRETLENEAMGFDQYSSISKEELREFGGAVINVHNHSNKESDSV